jgi:ComF family protein
VWAELVDLLYPPKCAGCGAPGTHLCAGCRTWFRRIAPPWCWCCGDPALTGDLPAGNDAAPYVWSSGRVRVPSDLCDACRRHPPAFDAARSIFSYDGPLREAIHALKYRGRRSAAGPLALLVADLAPHDLVAGVQAVIPVPLHPGRLAVRGFNQAELLARPLAARLAVPCVAGGLRRTHQEVAQATLGAGARRANVHGAFAPTGHRFRGRVLVVDDVFSTGSTAGDCARALRQAGASQVVVLTLARALLQAPTQPAELARDRAWRESRERQER